MPNLLSLHVQKRNVRFGGPAFFHPIRAIQKSPLLGKKSALQKRVSA